MADRGYIVIADITGYTRFLTGSEFDHAQGILEDLFAVILERMKSPLVLSNIEGDAFLARARDDSVPDGLLLIESLEALYWGFRARVQHMLRNTTCKCAACRNIADLDLKLIVHHGEYVEHELAGRKELSGPDVILAHRLLKNDIVKSTGIVSYAAFTSAAVAALDLSDYFVDAAAHTEESEEFGEIALTIVDVGAGWARHAAANAVVLGDDTDRWIPDVSHDFPYGGELLWHYLTAPEQRPRYVPGVLSLTRQNAKDGRIRAGAVDHCAHGKETFIFTILDVRPFRHITFDISLPLNAAIRCSILLRPIEQGTRIIVRHAKATAPGVVVRGFARLMSRFYTRRVHEEWVESLKNLEALIARDLAAGAVGAETAAAIPADHLQSKIRDAIGAA